MPSYNIFLEYYIFHHLYLQITPDILPIVDQLPGNPNILFAAGFSGIFIIFMRTYNLYAS